MVIDFDPVIFGLGPVQIRWYSLMYVVAYVVGGYIAKHLVKTGFFKVETKEEVDTMVMYYIGGMLIGARLFYVVIYNWDVYQNDLLGAFKVWEGGLSFHGALTGMIIAGYLFGKRRGISIGQMMDVLALSGAQGLLWGRIGNFINGELYGRRTDSWVGMIFKNGGPEPRHPSQLYEGFLEGFLLSVILWMMLKKVKVHGYIASVFLIGYGAFRFIVEFFREPDAQLGYYFGGYITMGQILCFIMIVVGSVAFYLAKKKAEPIYHSSANA